MKTISLVDGVSTLGNSLNQDNAIAGISNVEIIDSLKTLNAGKWVSFTKGAPAPFQGFDTIKKGLGYVVNTNAAGDVVLAGNPIAPNDMPIAAGLSMLAFPFDGRTIGDGYIPKGKFTSLKTIDGAWKSWTVGAAEGFQGFTTVDSEKGYVVNTEIVYGSFLDKNTPNLVEGVRFNVSDTTLSNGQTIEGVTYTDPNGVGSISFDKVSVDATLPPMIMFFSVGGVIAKIDVPAELDGEDFYVSSGGKTYKGNFVENESYASPTVISKEVDLADLEISYGSKTFDDQVQFLEMDISVNGIDGVIEFASEYAGDAFTVWGTNGEVKTGIFAAGQVTIS